MNKYKIKSITILILIFSIIIVYNYPYFSKKNNIKTVTLKDHYSFLWFKQAAIKYQPDQPLQYFSQWTYWNSKDWARHIEYGLKYLKPPLKDGDHVFEAGCGVGAYLKVVKELYPNVSLSGIDLVPEAIEIANKVLPGNFYVGNVIKLKKEKNNTYDYTASNGVIGYLNNLTEAYQMVQELVRITKKGKPIMISSIAENKNSAGSFNLFIPKSWWYKNADLWNVQITTISCMGNWPGAESQGSRYAVFMKKMF